MKKMDTIIFDLGGVLIDWNPVYLYKKLFDNQEDIDFFLQHIATSDWNEQQDAGRSLAEATHQLANRHPDYLPYIQAFYGRWEEMLGGPIVDSVALFQKLHNSKKYKLYALTNWSAETFPIAWKRYDFLHLFEDILVSGREKVAKPDPRIYQLAEERFQLQVGQFLFVDDNARNVRAAQKLNWTAEITKDPLALRLVLEKYGFLSQ